MAIIRYQLPAGDQSVFAVAKNGVLLGRSGDCDVRLNSPGVSRQHARIAQRNEQFVLEDLCSRNGTFVNGRRVTSPRRLRDGDRISVCGVRLIFHAGPGLDQLSGSWGNRPAGIWIVERLPDSSMQRRRILPGELVPVTNRQHAGAFRETDLVRRAASMDGLNRIRAEAVAAVAFIGQFQDRFRGCIRRAEVYSTLMESVLELFPSCDSCLLSRTDQDSGGIVVVAAVTREPDQDVTLCHSVIADSVSGKQLILRAEYWSPGAAETTAPAPDAASLRHVLCLPLSDRDSVVAVLQLVSGQQGQALNETDAERLTMLSSAISFLVCNAEEAERHFVLDERGDRNLVPQPTILSASERRPAPMRDPKGNP